MERTLQTPQRTCEGVGRRRREREDQDVLDAPALVTVERRLGADVSGIDFGASGSFAVVEAC